MRAPLRFAIGPVALALCLSACPDEAETSAWRADSVDNMPAAQPDAAFHAAEDAGAAARTPDGSAPDAAPDPDGVVTIKVGGGPKQEPRPVGRAPAEAPAGSGHVIGGREVSAVMAYARVDVSYVVTPIILFTDGSVCTNMNFALSSESANDYQARAPSNWSEWTEVEGRVALRSGSGLVYLQSQATYPPLPPGTRIAGAYAHHGVRSLEGEAAQADMRFFEDGRFVRGALPSDAADSVSADRRGSYEIDGYRIDYAFDDGSESSTSVVYRPSEPELLFLGGADFLLP
jgi:hypothetical protein